VWTNVLTDWALEALLNRTSPQTAERLVESVAVLLFFWGGVYLIRQVAGRWRWGFAPSLAVLCYGVVFHLGFLNYYVSAGLALWIAGLLWTPRPSLARVATAAVLAALAVLAHALPVLWVLAVLTYWHGSARIAPRFRIWILPVGLLML